ncbi:MAG TPA: glycoside hydrolase family 43 protein [Ktedonobacteraceae bacterium]|jgi:xylan 1,4-beta-xylosidase|nr:glycoside hydrolase family 43 protein [Ktedonobacteraceae bacterium]
MKEMITYTNPVVSGCYPNPSICRVGHDYYMITSSNEYFPGVPLLHSRDLVHWQHVGHCLTRASQLPLVGLQSSRGILAPTIRYHEGLFYVVATNVPDKGNFYVFSDDPLGEWSEPIWLQQGGIDPSLYFDDGHVYLSTSDGWPEPSIYQCEIDIKTGQQLTETRLLWRGSGGRYPEGPHLYHIGDFHYLLAAEGGTEYGHMETLARSRSPWGPFEPCPHNPILTHRNHGTHPIQGAGHADLIEAHDGSWWLVFHGFRPKHGLFHHIGREILLTPVTWTEDGWLLVSPDKTVDVEMHVKTLPQQKQEEEPERDDFSAPALRPIWSFLRNPRAEDWSLSERPGWLRLYGSTVTLNDLDSPAFVGRRQQHLEANSKALLDFHPTGEGHEAGLTLRMNEQHHYEIAVIREQGKRSIIVRRRIGDLIAIVARDIIPEEGLVELEIRAKSDEYTFLYTIAGQPTRNLASGATRYLSTEVVGGFLGVKIAMYATSNGNGKTAPADFDWFEYHP